MRALIFVPLILSTTASWSFEARWALQVTNPSYELFHYDLDDKEFKPFLEKTSWRCFAGAVEQKNDLALRTLRCNYSVDKTGEFTTTASCGDAKPYGEVFVDLHDEKKNLLFKVKLTCRIL